MNLELIKYRDAGMHTYTYFWVTSDHKVISPYFNSEEEAKEWHKTSWDNWKANKEL
jgi:hypothetical protein